jgi:sigma-B regulation protein RsbU (phosphoserine phosphatase)
LETLFEPEVERFSCIELRGGNHHARYSAEMPGLEGWVYCRPLRPSANGGDVYYLSVCSQGSISRITLADVVGHGDAVSRAAGRLHAALRRHASAFDQSLLIRSLNDTFLGDAEGSTEFATAFVIGYYAKTGELLFTNAGHPAPLWYRAGMREWTLMEESTPWSKSITDLPLGLIPGTIYTQTAVELAAGDMIVLYTDGVSEAANPAGEQLGQDRLVELVRQLPNAVDTPNSVTTAMLGSALLDAIEAYRGGVPAKDDETLIVLRRPPLVHGRE